MQWVIATLATSFSRNAVEAEGIKAVFHLGTIVGGVVMLILSRPSDGVRVPTMMPWLMAALMYTFFFSFSEVSAETLILTICTTSSTGNLFCVDTCQLSPEMS